MAKVNAFKLSRIWFDFCDKNPEKVAPKHTALYFFIIDLCNRLGWRDKIGLPSVDAKRNIGISNHRTYTDTLRNLVEWGFVEMIQESKNQYTSCIIALVKNHEANQSASSSALVKNDKALLKHCESIVNIDKLNKLIKPLNKNNNKTSPPSLKIYESEHLFKIPDLKKRYRSDEIIVAAAVKALCVGSDDDVGLLLDDFETYLTTQKITEKTESDFRQHFLNWSRKKIQHGNSKTISHPASPRRVASGGLGKI